MKHIKLIGTVLFTIGVFIFVLGFKVKNYNLYFLFVGGLIALIGFALAALIKKKEEKTANDEYKTWKENLVKNGIKTEVDLSKVEIKSNLYREEIINEGYSPVDKYKAFDTLVGKDNREYNNVKESVIVYEAEVLGKKRKFYSSTIPKDEITLLFLLGNQKKTFIYSDRLNQDNYFFDLEFLNE